MCAIVVLSVESPLERSLLPFFQRIVEEIFALMDGGYSMILTQMELNIPYVAPITC